MIFLILHRPTFIFIENESSTSNKNNKNDDLVNFKFPLLHIFSTYTDIS